MNQILNLQIQLLLAQYGRKQVLEVLAAVDGFDLAHIQRELQSARARLEAKARKRRNTRRKSAQELVETANLNSDVKPLIEQIALAYEGRELLSELWRVREFLESEGVDASKLRSRADALPKLIAVLANHPREKLEEVIAIWQERGDRNDLALLTDAILGSTKRTASVSRV